MSVASAPADALPSTPETLYSRGGKPMPELTDVLCIVAVLAEYARHISSTLEHRFLTRGFATIAQYFGTAAVSVMAAHIRRGMLRLVALEHLLRQRAERGRDLVQLAPRRSRARQAAASSAAASSDDALSVGAAAPDAKTETPSAGTACDAAPAPMPATARKPVELPLTFDTMPSMEEIEAEVRRRSVGQNLVEICRDLGIAPTLCAAWFWNDMHMAIYRYRGSIHRIAGEMRRRQKLLDRELWKYAHLTLPEDTREGVRKVVGFFIGEVPFDPYQPMPATEAGSAGAPKSEAPPDMPQEALRAAVASVAQAASPGGAPPRPGADGIAATPPCVAEATGPPH